MIDYDVINVEVQAEFASSEQINYAPTSFD